MFDLKSNMRDNTQTHADTHKHRTLFLLYAFSLSGMFLTAQVLKTISSPIQAQVLSVYEERPVEAPTASPTVSPSPAPTEQPVPQGTDVASLIAQRPYIEKYIKTIFKGQAKTAIAIASAESGTRDPKTREFYYKTYAVNKSDVELSVGVFQINLRNAVERVHYDRIPGSSEEEKVEWLKNPYNNTLYAFWVYTYSDFHPWSVFSSGKYLAFLK